MKTKKIDKITAVALAVIIALSSFITAFAQPGTIEIATPEDLAALSDNCRLDSFSKGKTVVLKNDIDLSGSEFSPIPVFCGTFDGNGCEISGFAVDGSVSENGFFTLLTQDAVVKDLTIEGEITADDDAEIIGGIAGTNNGKILNCTFNGSIKGEDYIGLIAAKNTTSGRIESCSAQGSATGSHFVGGIVGENSGAVSKCTNSALVNTTNEDNVMSVSSLPQIDLTNINSSTNTPLTTDIGGICGYSSGLIEYCENNGNIGYPHVGYNIGGIAGRHSGLLTGSKNSGTVQGRKDVGGICGQMVPDIDLDFNTDSSQKLQGEIEALQNMINDAAAEFSSSSKSISNHLNNISAYTQNAGESAENITATVASDSQANIAQIKSALAVIEKYQQRLEDILKGCDSVDEYINSAKADLDQAEKSLNDLDGLSDEGAQLISSARQELNLAAEDLKSAQKCINAIEDMLKSGNISISEIESNVNNAVKYLSSAAEHLNKTLPYLEKLGENLEKIYGKGNEAAKSLKSGIGNLKSALSIIDQGGKDIKAWCKDLSNEKAVTVTVSSAELTKNAENLQSGLNGIGNELSSLNSCVDQAGSGFQTTLDGISTQFAQIMSLMLSMMNNTKSVDTSKIYTDISEDAIYSATSGKTSACENYGEVSADVNTGGIVGTMALEYDFDPEDDITANGSNSSNFKFLSKAILTNSKNYGTVTSKKDCAGSITGNADLGIIFNCQGYGAAKSTSGNYVGGIAGKSKSNIKQCYAKARISGNSYIGGIVGEGENVTDCLALIKTEGSSDKTGMIAGKINGTAGKNYFVGDGAGIDRISYTGKAEPISFKELCEMPSTPTAFKKMTLKFIADGKTVKETDFSYGDTVEKADVPDIPQKDGCYAKWSQSDLTNLDFDLTVVAKYYPYLSVISGDDLRNGAQSTLIATGKFTEDDRLTIAQSDEKFANADEIIAVSANGSPEAFRYLPPTDDKYDLYINENGKWQKLKTENYGKYITFSCDKTEFTLCAVKSKRNIRKIIIPAAAVFIILLICVIIKLVKRRKGKCITTKR